jgi:hypothetical protein
LKFSIFTPVVLSIIAGKGLFQRAGKSTYHANQQPYDLYWLIGLFGVLPV